MRTRIKTLFPILLLIAGTTLFSNCVPKHDGCEETNTYKDYSIGENTLNQIPYRKDGLDTLVYISTDGDTAVLYGQGVRRRYFDEKVDEANNPDCNIYTNYKIQTVDYRYLGNQLDLNSLTFYAYNYVYSKSTISEVANYTNMVSYNVSFMGNPNNVLSDYYINEINNEKYYDDSIVVGNSTLYGKRMYSETAGIFVTYNKNYGAWKVEIGTKIWIKKF